MNLKRLLCVLMAAAMTLSLAVCSKDEPQEADDQNPGVQDGAGKTDDKNAATGVALALVPAAAAAAAVIISKKRK